MLTNLITSLVIAFGVGVSSFNMEHNINSKVDDVDMTSTIYKYSDAEKFFNQKSKFYLKDINFSDEDTKYLIPSHTDLMNSFYGAGTLGYSKKVAFNFKRHNSSVFDVINLYFDLGSSDYALMAEVPNGSRFPIYTLTNTYVYEYSGFFEGLNIMGTQYPSYNISLSYYEKQSGDLYNDNLGLILFYLSQYSFNGAQVLVKDTYPISLFYSDYYNQFVSTSNWISQVNPMVKYMYRGWFEVGGIYYNEIHAEFTSSTGKLFTSSNGNQTSFGSKIMLWSIVLRNTIGGYGLLAYQPFYDVVSQQIDRTDNSEEYRSYYLIDSYTDAWRIDSINFVSISCSGLPEYSSNLAPLGYFVPLSQLGDLSNNVAYVDLNQSLNLVSYAFKGLAQFLNIKILPFLNIGTLLLLPLIFVIVFAVVKMFKR